MKPYQCHKAKAEISPHRLEGPQRGHERLLRDVVGQAAQEHLGRVGAGRVRAARRQPPRPARRAHARPAQRRPVQRARPAEHAAWELPNLINQFTQHLITFEMELLFWPV